MNRSLFLGLGLAWTLASGGPAHADGPPTARDHYEGWTAAADAVRPLLVAHELALPQAAQDKLRAAPALRELWASGDPAIHLQKGVGEDDRPGIVGAGNDDDAQFTVSKSGEWSWRRREGSCAATRVVVGPRGGLVFCEDTTVVLHPKGTAEVDLRPLLDDVGPFRVAVIGDELGSQRTRTADLAILPVDAEGALDASRPGYAVHAVPPPQGMGDLDGLKRFETMVVENAVQQGYPDLSADFSDEAREIVQRVYFEDELERRNVEVLVARVRLDATPVEGGSDGVLTSAAPLGRATFRVKNQGMFTGMLRYQHAIGGGPPLSPLWGALDAGASFGGVEPVFQATWTHRNAGGTSVELAPNRAALSYLVNPNATAPIGAYVAWANGAAHFLAQTGAHSDAVSGEFGAGVANLAGETSMAALRARLDARFAVVESLRRTRTVGFSLEVMAYTEDLEAYSTFVFGGVTVSQRNNKVTVERRD